MFIIIIITCMHVGISHNILKCVVIIIIICLFSVVFYDTSLLWHSGIIVCVRAPKKHGSKLPVV